VKVEILPYQHTAHQPWFEKFNRDWIEKFFWMEPVDVDVLVHPDEHILKHKGHILMAQCDGEMAGTVALKFVSDGVYEFTKMAVDERFRGQKIGELLGLAAIDLGRRLDAQKIILYSNTILEPAIALYRKLGFTEVPLDGPYKRSNIKMEMELHPAYKLTVRTATLKDVDLIVSLGRQAFSETFAAVNSAENMNRYLDSTYNRGKIEEEFGDKSSVFFVAEADQEPVGFAKVRNSDAPGELSETRTLEIERIYVLKKMVGKGIGNILMSRCLQHARIERTEVVWLGVWESNFSALRFYEKWGFTHFSQHVFMLGNDAQTDLLLKKDLRYHGTPSQLQSANNLGWQQR
jgi:ribosomal protein S18 acetylase RimI-like enzyme